MRAVLFAMATRGLLWPALDCSSCAHLERWSSCLAIRSNVDPIDMKGLLAQIDRQHLHEMNSSSRSLWQHAWPDCGRRPSHKMKPRSSNAKSPTKAPAERVVKDIRRQTRRHFSAEDKIRIVLEGLRGVLSDRRGRLGWALLASRDATQIPRPTTSAMPALSQNYPS